MFHVEHSLAFSNTCRDNGLRLSPQQIELFRKYVELLREWNGKVNLVSRKDEENVWGSHILHSVSFLFGRSLPGNIRLLDIGTGGGLPGIPLAIVNSGWSVTLMDSIGKKVLATRDIAERLGMGNIEVVNGRAEEPSVVRERRGAYDIVVARGVASLAQLAKWSRPYLKRRTLPDPLLAQEETAVPSLVAYKGGDLESELQELRIKVPGAAADVRALVFSGSADAGLEEKKIVVVQFT